METFEQTPIYFLEELLGNRIYIMRDDLLPFSFGGNKARKATLFFEEISNGDYDTVVTYGSGSSNHCRICANMAAANNLDCIVISPDNNADGLNRHLVQEIFGAQVRICPVEKVAQTIDDTLAELKSNGRKPFFIPGGGHGNNGTRAYDLAYNEIAAYPVCFDYIFHASGTGTTQAGLICGKLRHKNENQSIVGISIARRNPRGGQIVAQSVRDYLGQDPGPHLIFDDNYICGGYGQSDKAVNDVIRRMMRCYGLPLDPTYTGKAYAGMEQYLQKHLISGKNILFIHTGGTPLFYDWVDRQ